MQLGDFFRVFYNLLKYKNIIYAKNLEIILDDGWHRAVTFRPSHKM